MTSGWNMPPFFSWWRLSRSPETPGVARASTSSQRRRNQRLRSLWRHEQSSTRMAFASAMHHSHMGVARVATQTEDAAATYAATASVPLVEHLAPAPNIHVVPAHAVERVAHALVTLIE